jgi:CYTH domain-containing protein
VSTEIERKYLLDALPDADTLGSGTRIRQGYLAEDGDVEVRVRITPARSSLTIKSGRGRSRTEVDIALAPADAESLWALTAPRRIDKTRYVVPLPPVGRHATEVAAEVDVYAGALAGLRVVEVEFASAAAAAEFVPPAWFGREVTDDGRWSNASLARSGRPDPAGDG